MFVPSRPNCNTPTATAQAIVDGVEMGVLLDGTPYLTARGLAKLCGVAYQVMGRLTSQWQEEKQKPRGQKIAGMLEEQGYHASQLHVVAEWNGNRVHAHPDAVCMAILEYYAFEAGNKVALTAYRLLARQTLRQFIYHRVGYDPESRVARCWRKYQERILLNRPREGYFSAFNQTADLVVTSIYEGLEVDDHTVPDISVGQTWAEYWKESKLDEQFGERIRHLHKYPDDYPQSRVNPVKTWAYPNAAWGEFQDWLHKVYLPDKFPAYVRRKLRQGALPAERADSLLAVTGAHVSHRTYLVGEPKTVHPALPEPVERPGRRVS